MPARNAGGFRCREKKEKAKQPGRGGSTGFCSSAWLVEEKEREREITRPGTERRRRRARWGGVAAARERLPDVEERGTASEGNAGGGRRDRATLERGAELQELRGGRRQESRARAEEQRRSGAWGRRWRTQLQKAENSGASL
jgi:hypothetical protein